MKQMSKRPWNSIGKSVTYPHVFSPFQFLYPSASGVPYEMKWWWESKANCFLKLGKITTTTYHIITAFCSTWFTKRMTHYYFPQRNSLCYKSAFEAYFLWNICTRLKKIIQRWEIRGGNEFSSDSRPSSSSKFPSPLLPTAPPSLKRHKRDW